MQNFIGREPEIRVLTEALESAEPELVLVIGRRRVGKTFLVRHVYGRQMVFEFSGVKETSAIRQLERFGMALTDYCVKSLRIFIRHCLTTPVAIWPRYGHWPQNRPV